MTTLQNLNRALAEQQEQYDNSQELSIFKNKPFYDWDNPINNTDTFNHIIGLPTNQEGKENPLFDYEHQLFNELQNHKLIWLLKATGLGITEFVIRYIVWLCVRNDELKGSHVCIVTGPRIDLAIAIIDRIKELFMRNNLVSFETKNTVVYLNGVKIEAFPSNHLDSMRGIANVSFIFLDEADFFSPGEQQNARDISERYIAKSNPHVVMVSTPNQPGGLFESMMNEPNSIYHRMFMDYTYGLGKIYDSKQIEIAQQSPGFEREYNLKFLGNIGNLISQQYINDAIEEYDLSDAVTTSPYFPRWIGIDPGYASSNFGICVVQYCNDKLEVVYTASLDKPLYTDTLHLVRQLVQKYHVCKVFIDGSASHLIHELKHGYGEYIPYEKLKPDVLERQIQSGCGEPLIIPINFQKHHKSMAKHTVKALAHKRVRIHPKKFDDLIISLKSATTKEDEWTLDKPRSISCIVYPTTIIDV